MEKTKLEFTATITTPDGKVITKKVVEEIPSINENDKSDLTKFMTSFDDYEWHALKARNTACEEITQAWFDEQAKRGTNSKETVELVRTSDC